MCCKTNSVRYTRANSQQNTLHVFSYSSTTEELSMWSYSYAYILSRRLCFDGIHRSLCSRAAALEIIFNTPKIDGGVLVGCKHCRHDLFYWAAMQRSNSDNEFFCDYINWRAFADSNVVWATFLLAILSYCFEKWIELLKFLALIIRRAF